MPTETRSDQPAVARRGFAASGSIRADAGTVDAASPRSEREGAGAVDVERGSARHDAVTPAPDASAASARSHDDAPPASSPRPVPATMRAVVQHRYGDADVLGTETVPVPRPAADQVLVEVDAAGVDRGVWHLMSGLPWLVRLAGFGLVRPKQPVPGLDVSGRVVAVGASVEGFAVGDEVFGVGSGTFAEYALAKAEKLAPRPPGVPSREAAAVPISGLTALQALRDIGRVRPGQRVLVLGASGGVGGYAVQLARHFGARVTGVASAPKLAFVRGLGAERVVDYAREDALDGRERYDLILDIGGRRPLRALRRALVPDGTLVVIGGEDGDRLTGGVGRQLRALLLSPFVSQRLTTFVSAERGDDIATLGELLASGAFAVPLERAYRLEEAPLALADLAAGRVRGKVVVEPRASRARPSRSG